MKIYTFEKNKDGKIEIYQEEFENMLNEAYDDGYANGYAKGKAKDVVYWPVYPAYPTYDKWTITTQPNTNPYKINCTYAGGIENVTRDNK